LTVAVQALRRGVLPRLPTRTSRGLTPPREEEVASLILATADLAFPGPETASWD